MGIRSTIVIMSGLVALATGTGCAGPSAAAESQMDGFRKEISKVQSDNDRLNERVSALEGAQSRGAPDVKRKDGTPEGPKLQVVKLVPGQDPDALATEGDDEAAADSSEPTVIRAEGNRVTQAARSKEKAKETSRSAQAKSDYDAAVSLVKHKQYDKALEALAGFLVRFPDDPSADNAMYWRGECFFAKGDYSRAAEEFLGVTARFPNGNKVPDALLKLGMSQLKTGEKDKAADSFARLRREYPASDAARKIPRE
jgi:tol-pal system protein YbgF